MLGGAAAAEGAVAGSGGVGPAYTDRVGAEGPGSARHDVLRAVVVATGVGVEVAVGGVGAVETGLVLVVGSTLWLV